MNDAVLNKKESLERCIRQVRKYYTQETGFLFEEDFFKQDAIAINLQRICEIIIDLANMAVRKRKLGLPKESKESFEILKNETIISAEMNRHLSSMIGFRNTLVHQYQKLDIKIMRDVIENHLDELVDFSNIILRYFEGK